MVPKDEWENPTEWTIFAFLHELGHIKTNTPDMKRYYQEYLATQWAIEESEKLKFKYPASYIKTYQNYIWKWRQYSIIRKGKNILSKEDVTLKEACSTGRQITGIGDS